MSTNPMARRVRIDATGQVGTVRVIAVAAHDPDSGAFDIDVHLDDGRRVPLYVPSPGVGGPGVTVGPITFLD